MTVVIKCTAASVPHKDQEAMLMAKNYSNETSCGSNKAANSTNSTNSTNSRNAANSKNAKNASNAGNKSSNKTDNAYDAADRY